MKRRASPRSTGCATGKPRPPGTSGRWVRKVLDAGANIFPSTSNRSRRGQRSPPAGRPLPRAANPFGAGAPRERKGVVQGERGAGRVDLGGRRSLHKKKRTRKQQPS